MRHRIAPGFQYPKHFKRQNTEVREGLEEHSTKCNFLKSSPRINSNPNLASRLMAGLKKMGRGPQGRKKREEEGKKEGDAEVGKSHVPTTITKKL